MNSKLSSPSRRRVLRAAGGIALSLPFLESLVPRSARAATPESRFLVLYTPNGSNNLTQFQPQGFGTDFTLGTETAPLLPYKSKLLALTGIDMKTAPPQEQGDSHSNGMGHMLTARAFDLDPKIPDAGMGDAVGFANGISIDQEIAKNIGSASRYKSLEFGVQTTVRYGNHPFSRMIYAGPLQPISPEDNPLAAYNRLFAGSVTPPVPGMLDENLRRRKSVIDLVIQEYQTVNASVSADDKVRLDQHLSMLREVERGLALGGPSTASCTQPGAAPTGDPMLHANFPTVGHQQADLMVLALSCGLTRVASLQYSYARSNERLEWINTADCAACGTIVDDHHTISHMGGDPKADAQMAAINHWYSEQIAYVIQKMDSIDEGAGKLLDNSLAFWCSEISYASTHTYSNIRAFLFGSAGGKIRTGQHLDFGSEEHNKLHVTFLNAMGIPATTFGDPGFANGPLPGILV